MSAIGNAVIECINNGLVMVKCFCNIVKPVATQIFFFKYDL